ncbi:MAG: BrnT family toxin [Chloroflexi bacterium]|nr:BrnT family toxin [Chloroflexota bacterium]MBK7179209.1 BrnT family toxin [Chloroflexota bacterium]MBK7920036.1 BrnT family toxin [Chloroflexota bacterium]MBK8932224.1 BrnT family toxin [Chloroflexota bacterium]
MKNILSNCNGFHWDEGNLEKNWHLHEVTNGECEELFFNLPLIVASDDKHSQLEQRFYALGRTDRERWLFVAFTIRNSLIRVISARDMNQKEARKYSEQVKRYTDLQK